MIKKILLIICILFVTKINYGELTTKENSNKVCITKEKKSKFKNDWEILIHALIMTESRGNDTIVGKHNDGGCLQITPIYVEEVNRILVLSNKQKRYTLKDRFNRKKSIEMFEIIQHYYNPKKDIYKAIKLHNPLASEEYKFTVLYYFEKLKNTK
jgi:hypothetical protein